jgi:asparagine synthase (glutamine-hydrolysing)
MRRPLRVPQWLGPAVLNAARESREGRVQRDLSALAGMSFDDITRGNVPAALSVGDRNAMAHSVESRVPFLDHELVEFAFRLPDDLKTSRGEHKIVLRDVARRRLPAQVAERRARVGFGAPIRDWMRGPLRSRLQEIARSTVVRDGDLFNPHQTERFIAGFLEGKHDDDATVWRIDALVRWIRVCDVVMS